MAARPPVSRLQCDPAPGAHHRGAGYMRCLTIPGQNTRLQTPDLVSNLCHAVPFVHVRSRNVPQFAKPGDTRKAQPQHGVTAAMRCAVQEAARIR